MHGWGKGAYQGAVLSLSLWLPVAGCSSDTKHAPPLPDFKTLPTDRIPAHTSAFEPRACWVTPPAAYAVECGYVTAPARAADPTAASVRLAVAIVYSNATNVAGDPVVYLDGGPGADSIAPLLGGSIPFQSVLEDHDLILFDQRGTGFSEPKPVCNEPNAALDASAPLDAGPTSDGGGAHSLDAIASCRDQLTADGLDLSIYRSSESAADVTAIRRAIGYERWNLYGISYGTRYALVTLRDQPAGVSHVVLDSVVPPQADLLDDEGASIYGSLHTVSTACAAQSACNAAFGDMESKELAILARLDATPAQVQASDGSSFTVTATLAASLFTSLLYSGEAIRYLPQIVQDIYDADYSVFEGPLAADSATAVSVATYLSVMCAEEAPFSSRAVMDERTRNVPTAWKRWIVPTDVIDACTIWNVPAAPPIENEPVTSDLPTLVLSGVLDPVTPPAYGALAAQTLSKSQSIVLSDQAHGSSISDCGKRLVHAFLYHPESKVDDPCIDSAPLSFVTPTALAGARIETASRIRFATTGERPPRAVLEEALRRAARAPVLGPRTSF